MPQDIELEKFPTAVLSEAGELAACRYFIADDQLTIVDPEDDKVVLLIDKIDAIVRMREEEEIRLLPPQQLISRAYAHDFAVR